VRGISQGNACGRVFVHVECVAGLPPVDGGSAGSSSSALTRGIGELSAGGLATDSFCGCALACLALIQARIVGQDPRNVVALTAPLLAQATSPPPEAGGGKGALKIWLCAVSAVEQALWDILGKSVGASPHQAPADAHCTALAVQRTPRSVKLTFLSLQLTFLSLQRTFLSLKLTFLV
jgi:hypothetical protein